MKKSISVKSGICFLAAVLLLSACGQAESAGTTTTSTEIQSSGDLAESETSKEAKETSLKEEATKGETTKEETTIEEPASSEGETTEKESQTEGETSAETTTAEETTAAPQQNGGKSVDSIYQEIVQNVALNSPMVLSDDFIVNYYGIDVNTLDEYVFSMSEASTSAETVAILKAKDSADTANLSASLQMVLDQKRAEMENYLPDQFQIVDKSSVKVSGNYVYLVISEQAAAITPIIEAGIQ